ncbi:MAG TPA: type IV secretory system conjugative DNA transfer family protein [Pseudoxanthomonas sp.]|nr:type IV secretory system conjugative DNA transfer family protein [Pseudoxanthomonas sp.]
MSKGKGIFVVVVGLVALVAGLYFSGFLALLLLKQQHLPLAWNTYYGYYKALDIPAWAQYAGKIKMAGAVGFGLPLLAWAGLLIPLLRNGSGSGDNARFAHSGDLHKAGLLKNEPTGIVVGRFGGKLMKVGQSRHVLLASPTRSGKGVGVVIPNLLEYKGSVVVLDVKREAFDITGGYRATLGPVYLFDPFTDDLCTHQWNPLSYVSLESHKRDTDLQGIAGCLYRQEGGQDPFWANMSRETFVTLCHYLFDRYQTFRELGEAYPTIGKIYRLLSGEGMEPKETKQEFFKRLATENFLSAKAKLGLGNLASLADQTFSSVIATTQSPIALFGNPVVDAATSGNSFWLHDLRRTVQSVYVGVPPSKLVEAKNVLNLFFEQAIKLNGSVLPQQDETLKQQCLFLLDEFTALGRVDIVPTAVGWLAGYGVRILCVIQSVSQLEAVYGAETARSMVTNLGCQIIFAPREQRDAEEFSNMLGEKIVRRRQRTQSHGGGGSVSYTEIEERVPLMRPQEIKALSPKREIVIMEGLGSPVLGDKIRYYEDRYFIARLNMGKVQAPLLQLLGRGRASNRRRLAS